MVLFIQNICQLPILLSRLLYHFPEASLPCPHCPCSLCVSKASQLQTVGSPGASSCHRRVRKGHGAHRRRPREACQGLEQNWLLAALPQHQEQEAATSGCCSLGACLQNQAASGLIHANKTTPRPCLRLSEVRSESKSPAGTWGSLKLNHASNPAGLLCLHWKGDTHYLDI